MPGDFQRRLRAANDDILDTYYIFKLSSTLGIYLSMKNETYAFYEDEGPSTIFTLRKVITHLKVIIREEGLYDPRNPAVIICDDDLDIAIDKPGLHVTEVRPLVLLHLVLSDYVPLPARFCCGHARTAAESLATTSVLGVNLSTPPPAVRPAAPVPSGAPANCYSDKMSLFKMSPELRNALLLVPSFPTGRSVFRYDEITSILSDYILANMSDLADRRHPRLLFIGDDPLERAFQVDTVHRVQITGFLRKALSYAGRGNLPANYY
jgi:hypothetical protein